MPAYQAEWREQVKRTNDSTFTYAMELRQKDYEEEYPDFGLLDWNQDGYEDLFFEYYGLAGTGVKWRVDVYLFDPKVQGYESAPHRFMNPAFFLDSGIITSHYIAHGAGWAEKYKIKHGRYDTLEHLEVDFTLIADNKEQVSVRCYDLVDLEVDTFITNHHTILPAEYRFEKLILNQDDN